MSAQSPRPHLSTAQVTGALARLKFAGATLALGLGMAALSAPASAQQSADPVLHADLSEGMGSGSFTAVITPASGRMCYMLNVATYEPATAAHIHKGKQGEDGPVAVPLATPDGGASGDCVDLAPDVAKAMLADPSDYYVNIHTASLPKGAVRGQLQGNG